MLQGWAAPDAEQERLRRRYLDHLAAWADGWSRECSEAHITASALVCDAAVDQVLLVLHAKVGWWLQTGGHLEPTDGSLPAAALREATEESGLSDLVLDPVPLLLSEHDAPCRPGCRHLDVQFRAVGAVTAPTVSVESTDVRWFAHDALPETDTTVTDLVTAARARAHSRPLAS